MSLIGRLIVIFIGFLAACFVGGMIVVVALLFPEFADLGAGPVDHGTIDILLGFGFIFVSGFALVPAAVNAPKRPEDPLPPDESGRAASKLVKSEQDPDAAWTKKDGKYYFGYKLHAAMDKQSRIIRRLLVTPANVNESEPADQLICGDEKIVYADKAYDSKERRRRLTLGGIKNGIMRRGHPRRPLTQAEVRRNQRLAKHRGAIEPLFSLFKNVYGFARARYRGLARNTCAFTLAAIAINLKRWATCLKGDEAKRHPARLGTFLAGCLLMDADQLIRKQS